MHTNALAHIRKGQQQQINMHHLNMIDTLVFSRRASKFLTD